MTKENSQSFDDKKKGDIVIIYAIMNLMMTRQRDDEDLTDYTKVQGSKRPLYILEGNQPQEESPKSPLYQEDVSQVQVTSHVQTIEDNAKFLTPKEIAQANVARQLLNALGYHWWSTSRPS